MPSRIIKESICTSRKINMLSAEEEVFFYRLLVNCDDFGCFFGEADVLGGKLYPRRKMQDAKIKKLRDAIVNAGLAFLYIHNDETFICISQWEEHQRMRNQRRKFPEPTPENTICGNSRTNDSNTPTFAARAGASASSESDSSSRYSSDSRYEEDSTTPRARAADTQAGFDEFWAEYPKKAGKGAAKKAFEKVDPSVALLRKMLDAISAARDSEQWQRESGRYIPNPATWLNQGRWEDELPKSGKARSGNVFLDLLNAQVQQNE